MAKMRGIKPEFWTDDKVVGLDAHARLLFIGMWNFACDNGHLDDSALQLKMRVLPVDNVDIAALVDSLVEAGVLERRNGYLKVVNLSEHQRIDTRYLTLCDHCDLDGDTTFHRGDKKPRTKSDDGDTTGAQRAHDVQPAGARAEGRKEGSEKKEAPPRPEVEALCIRLADRIEANGAKRPNIGKTWLNEARLLLDSDKYDYAEVEQLIDWCQADSFWRSNILSMTKFRDQYDRLKMQSERSGPRGIQADPWAHVQVIKPRSAS